MTDIKKHLSLPHKEWFKASVINKRIQAFLVLIKIPIYYLSTFFHTEKLNKHRYGQFIKTLTCQHFFSSVWTDKLDWQAGLTNDDKWLMKEVDGDWCLSGWSVSYPTCIRISDRVMFNNVLARNVWCVWKDNSYAIVCMLLNCRFNLLVVAVALTEGYRYAIDDHIWYVAKAI